MKNIVYGTPMVKSPEDVRDEISKKLETVERNSFDLAELYHIFYTEKMYEKLGYKTLQSCITKEFKLDKSHFHQIKKVGKLLSESSRECRAWIKSERISAIRHISHRITNDNWKEWKQIINGMTAADVRLFMAGNGGIHDPMSLDGKTDIQKAAQLRRDGFSCDFTASSLGIMPGHVHSCTRTVTTVLDIETYNAIKAYADQNKHSISDEIAFILTEIVKDEQAVANG